MTVFTELKGQLQLAMENKIKEAQKKEEAKSSFVKTIETHIMNMKDELNDLLEMAEVLQSNGIKIETRVSRYDCTISIENDEDFDFLILKMECDRIGAPAKCSLCIVKTEGFQNFFYKGYADRNIPISLNEKEILTNLFAQSYPAFKDSLKKEISEIVVKYNAEN